MDRRTFWIAVGVLMLVSVLGGWSWPGGLLLAPAYIAVLVMRLNDAGRSGWLVLLPVAFVAAAFVAGLFVGGVVFPDAGGDGAGLAGGLLGIAAGALGFLGFAAWAGTLPRAAGSKLP